MLLVIDNYDSFVYNLARYFERLGQETLVVRNDAVTVRQIAALRPGAIVLSPGPCAPKQAGCSLDLVRQLYRRIPLLGVCLGHQTIAAALGGRVVRSSAPMHGQASEIQHARRGLFDALPSPLRAARYHSLIVEEASLPSELEVTARTAEGTIMAIAHRRYPVVGAQFHPESVLTERGYQMLANFLRMAGLPVSSTPEEFCPQPATTRGSELPEHVHPLTF